MKETSMVTISTAAGKIGRLQMSCIEMLDDNDRGSLRSVQSICP
jgi:hypothetical protein